MERCVDRVRIPDVERPGTLEISEGENEKWLTLKVL
jgi:hypothetical protein